MVYGDALSLRKAFSLACGLIITAGAFAGPSHWGFGQGYLAAVEKTPSGNRLAVYEAPLRAKNTTWYTRWLDRGRAYEHLAPGGIAVGDFWPSAFGKAWLVTVTQKGASVDLNVLEPPEMFTTKPWPIVGYGTVDAPHVAAAAAADVLGQGNDQMLLLGTDRSVTIVTPPASQIDSDWTVAKRIKLPLKERITGFCAGDFWGDKRGHIAVATTNGKNTVLRFYRVDGDSLRLEATDAARDIPSLAANGLAAGDYLQDGFAALTLIPTDPQAAIQVRVAPARTPAEARNPGPVYNGRALSRQWLPGVGGRVSKVTMYARFGDPDTDFAKARARRYPIPQIVGLGVGPLFGYVRTDLTTTVRAQNTVDPKSDAEIAFCHRFPQYSLTAGAPNYGWPAHGEEMGYEINIKNNGETAIPAGAITLKVWINTPFRNADTNDATAGKPDYVIPIAKDLPPFDPAHPSYLVEKVTTKWPYSLIPSGPGATWKKLNLADVGERWMVAVLDVKGDDNARNNRFEAALHAHTLHPIWRSNLSLADRVPTVGGDPASKENLSCKLADALTCMWERSGTAANEDVPQRVFFDGYEVGWPNDLPEPARSEKWKAVQDKYEGWRELDGWYGENQGWERFGWADGQAELHEAGHLFHPLGDLYQYAVSPTATGTAVMADGTPVQIGTYCWGPDSFSTGHAMIGPPACEMMRRYVVGGRGGSPEAWWELAPEKMFIRVLDRKGRPVPGAKVGLWPLGSHKPCAKGVTGKDGRWDTGYPKGKARVDRFGVKHYDRISDQMAYLVTVGLPGYQQAAALGQDTVAAHGQHTIMYHALIDPKGWTWDVRTNYEAGADKPDFTVTAAVQGSRVELAISGKAGAAYRVYRRWEPAYFRTVVGAYRAKGASVVIPLDLADADSHRGGRFRAIYEVTRLQGKRESLPRVIQVAGLKNARGVTAVARGKLLVAANSGIANPWGILFTGTTPYEELLYHYRFGHTANKIVPSILTPGRYYATLASSDMRPDYRFDVIEPPKGDGGYDVRNDLGSFKMARCDGAVMTLERPEDAARILPGDGVIGPLGEALVTRVEGTTITTDKPVCAAGANDQSISAVRLAGRPGDRAEMRELKDARGLAVLTLSGREYVVIADTGNGRVVVWDSDTRYVTHADIPGGAPAAVAVDTGRIYVLDRRPDGKSLLHAYQFDGRSLAEAPGFPVAAPVSDSPGEMGLALRQNAGQTVFVMTDCSSRQVLEFAVNEGTLKKIGTYGKAVGAHAGPDGLSGPVDVACTSGGMYVVDGGNRIVRVK